LAKGMSFEAVPKN